MQPNTTDTAIDGGSPYSLWIRISFWIVGAALLCFAFLSNSLVLIVLALKKNLRQQTYTVLVICLSSGDLVITISAILQVLDTLLLKSKIFCRIYALMLGQGIFMSVYCTFIVSLYRYLSATGTPWKEKLFDGGRKYAQLFVPSGIVVAIHISFIAFWDKKDLTCNIEIVFRIGNVSVYSLVATVMNLPVFLCTFVLFALAVRAINKRFGQALHPTATGTALIVSDGRRKKQVAALKTLGIIMMCLIVGTAPFLLVFLFNALNFQIPSAVHSMFGIGVMLNSTINPIIYTWKLQAFRKEMGNLLCRCCRE